MRRRKTEVNGLVIFRIDIVLSKHIVHRCLFDEIDQDGRIDILAILFLDSNADVVLCYVHSVFLRYFIRYFCAISFGILALFGSEFLLHKIYGAQIGALVKLLSLLLSPISNI